jgi:hypothetical protein
VSFADIVRGKTTVATAAVGRKPSTTESRPRDIVVEYDPSCHEGRYTALKYGSKLKDIPEFSKVYT